VTIAPGSTGPPTANSATADRKSIASTLRNWVRLLPPV
jgi:hypothetical protein